MIYRNIFLSLFALIISYCPLQAQQVEECICEKLSGGCEDNWEIITQTIEVRPRCNWQEPLYQEIKKKVIKSPCDERLIQYPCDCKEKAKPQRIEEVTEPALYITVTFYDCEGKHRKEKILVREERTYRRVQAVPELQKKD